MSDNDEEFKPATRKSKNTAGSKKIENKEEKESLSEASTIDDEDEESTCAKCLKIKAKLIVSFRLKELISY